MELIPPEKLSNVRPTICFLTYGAGDPINHIVWSGIADAAREGHVNLICFPGNALRSTRGFEAQANVLYDLVSREIVDGVILWGGAISHFVGDDGFRKFCERYHPLPMVNISLLLEGIPSVVLDNYQGMRDAVAHLITVHGLRRIAFICGPALHSEANDRYQGYVDALAEYDIPLDPDLVMPGDFKGSTGKTAIQELLDQRKVVFEAIVAANDDMTIGAMEALQARGIRVPADVAVVGLADMEEAKYVTPPLTTARYPFYEHGRRAVEMVLALLRGEDVPEQVIIPSTLMVRQSCGCVDPEILNAAVAEVTTKSTSFDIVLTEQRDLILTEMIRALGGTENTAQRVNQVFEGFVADVQGESQGVFLRTLDEVVLRGIASGGTSAHGRGRYRPYAARCYRHYEKILSSAGLKICGSRRACSSVKPRSVSRRTSGCKPSNLPGLSMKLARS